ncbi:MAG: adenosylcobinamide-GDP ribazoletransferase, partial [Clostridiales bacterium]
MYKEFCLLLGFVSRLPIRIRWDSKEEDWGRSFRLLPLWGLVLGTMIASVLAIFSLVSIPVAAVCGVGFCVLITGGLHLDGLMDVADGLGSCQDREKTFAIMKDSLVGSMGVTAAVILLLSKFALYWQLIADWRIFWVLPAALVFSRWLVAWAIFTFPAARPTGLGAT